MGGGEAQALVATKLTPPTLPAELVTRRRLDDALDAAAADPLVRVVLVSAPAGSGKSTLLAAWQRHRTDGAWLQCDPPIVTRPASGATSSGHSAGSTPVSRPQCDRPSRPPPSTHSP